ncbi:hypothetical protein F5Y02DRAFT_420759 [Annulohypoxylon stygium]|nr:hypothetical protein F5Y02DRAFT_420759 [Annulohypoxylon stygium]
MGEFEEYWGALGMAGSAQGTPEETSNSRSESAGLVNSAKSPSVRAQVSPSPDKPGQLDGGDDNTQKNPTKRLSDHHKIRGPLRTIPELKEYLEMTFKPFASWAGATLQPKLKLTKKLNIEYKLVGRYPKSLDDQQGARISPCISFTVPNDYEKYRQLVLNSQPRNYAEVSYEICTIMWDVIRLYEFTKNNLATSWTDILVVEFFFDLLDGQTEPYRHCTLPKMVYLMMDDKEHYALHDTLVIDESKAKYNQSVILKKFGGS